MAKKFQLTVFGKAGCEKCKVLNARIDALLEKPEWGSDFEKAYADAESEDGLVAFAKAECISPNRIPAVLVSKLNDATGKYAPLANPTPGKVDPLLKKAKLYQYLGMQTDYTDEGKGLITPKMIASLLEEARAVG